ncbi:uncharacterized protein LOC144101193 isoform X1 [Amblyomma americanum]
MFHRTGSALRLADPILAMAAADLPLHFEWGAPRLEGTATRAAQKRPVKRFQTLARTAWGEPSSLPQATGLSVPSSSSPPHNNTRGFERRRGPVFRTRSLTNPAPSQQIPQRDGRVRPTAARSGRSGLATLQIPPPPPPLAAKMAALAGRESPAHAAVLPARRFRKLRSGTTCDSTRPASLTGLSDSFVHRDQGSCRLAGILGEVPENCGLPHARARLLLHACCNKSRRFSYARALTRVVCCSSFF